MSDELHDGAVWRRHGFRIDASERPIVTVRYPITPTAEGYRAAMDHYVELAAAGENIAWIVDMRVLDGLSVSASARREASQIFKVARPKLEEISLCEARILEGLIARGVSTAFDWLAGPPWPVTSVATMEEARAWVAQYLPE